MDQDLLRDLYDDFKKGEHAYMEPKLGVTALHFVSSICGSCCCCTCAFLCCLCIWWLPCLWVLPLSMWCLSSLALGMACSSTVVLYLLMEPKFMAFMMKEASPETFPSTSSGPAIVV